jgi:phage terminase large subunit GpA-like protein
VRDTPVLAERLVYEKGRKATQTKTKKFFLGGATLRIIGAKSPKGFQAIQARVAIGDDLDEWEVSKHGDPVLKLIDRTKGIWNRKIILVSYPTTEEVSRIWSYFLKTDQRYRWVPCPHCDEGQVLEFGGRDTDYGLKWDSRDDAPYYLCKQCHKKIEEYHKDAMNTAGEWRAREKFNGWAGFKLNPFLRSWHRWEEIRNSFLSCGKDPFKLMVFTNQTLGNIYKEDTGIKVDEHILYARRELYPADVPMGVKIITASVDTQDNRLECKVKGYGQGEEQWLIEFKIFNGSPVEQKVWDALDNYLLRTFKHESGFEMPIKAVCVDAGGHFSTQVYEFCKSRESRNIYAVIGSNDPKADVLDGPLRTNKATGAKYQRAGVTTLKDMLFGRLRIKRHGPGYYHYPNSTDMEYFIQLFGERLIITASKKREYRPVPGRHNESIDLDNYCMVALRMLKPDWEAIELGRAEDMGRKVHKIHQVSRHCDSEVEVSPKYPIVVCATFNKNPLVWELAQTDGKQVWVFDEIAIRGGDTAQMAIQVQRRYGQHKKGFLVYGGARGSIQSSAKKSEYAILSDYGFNNHRYRRLDPPEVDCINAINNMLENIAGEVKLTYHPKCILLKRDFDQCLWLEDGSEIDRTDFGRGNATDALGHFIVHEFPLTNLRPTKRAHWK